MLLGNTQVVAAVAVLVTGVLGSLEFVEEMRREFKGGVILPRVASNLQTFQGALGGAKADPVRLLSLPTV